MRNFLQIAANVDTTPLLHELSRQSDLWGKYPVRTAHEQSAHHGMDDIVLRYSPYDEGDDYLDKVCASIHVVDYPPWFRLPMAHPIIYGLMARVGGVHLGRCMISRMQPGQQIPWHSDRIDVAEARYPDRPAPAVYYERYQVALQSAPGVVFACGADDKEREEVYMPSGTVWWFNNCLLHSVVNGSAEERIALIVDIRTAHDDYVPR